MNFGLLLLSGFNSHHCVQLKIFISFCLFVACFKRKNLQLKVSDLVHSERVERKLASEQRSGWTNFNVLEFIFGTKTWCNETKEIVWDE